MNVVISDIIMSREMSIQQRLLPETLTITFPVVFLLIFGSRC